MIFGVIFLLTMLTGITLGITWAFTKNQAIGAILVMVSLICSKLTGYIRGIQHGENNQRQD